MRRPARVTKRSAMAQRTRVQELLGLRRPPVAIGFFDEAPAGVRKYDGGAVPAGCAFWQTAQEGDAFYTEQGDHANCAVGAYTHNIPLPQGRTAELDETIGFMVTQKYLQPEDVQSIPTMPASHAFVAYGRADEGAFDPDVVVVAAEPAQAMLLNEAAMRAGAGDAAASTLGRPGCAIVPLTVNGDVAAMSLGCKGNRTYTGLPDSELYVSVPGAKWNDVAASLEEILAANAAMGAYYQSKLDSVLE